MDDEQIDLLADILGGLLGEDAVALLEADHEEVEEFTAEVGDGPRAHDERLPGSGSSRDDTADPAPAPQPAEEPKITEHRYGCLMAMLPPDAAKQITDWGLEHIQEFQLGPGGRIYLPHATIKYGFTDDSPAAVNRLKEIIEAHGPITLRLRNPSTFPAGKDGVPLKVDVTSADLRQLNRETGDAVTHEDTHPDYHPHVTIAYLDPAFADSCKGIDFPPAGTDVVCDRVVWSDRDKKEQEIPIAAKKMAEESKEKPPEGPAPEQVALPGRDGDQAEQLLENAKSKGAAVMAAITAAAIKRMVKDGHVDALWHTDRLYNDEELRDLTDVLASAIGTANLLGRSKVRMKADKAQQDVEKFDEDDSVDFSCFAEPVLKPLAPLRAIAYFKSLVPSLDVQPELFGPLMLRRSFTLAVRTSTEVLQRVQNAILQRLETGQGMSTAVADIKDILDAAGITQTVGGRTTGGQYSELIFRTNMMDSYNAGADEERQEVKDVFPAWQYVGIHDGREGDDHRPHFDKYFSSDIPFAKVRNLYITKPDPHIKGARIVVRDPTGRGRIWNCRCGAKEVTKRRWAKLQSEGAQLSML